ncbi:unnamed protein product [Diatraea saccharalis]|uniref:Uncharacterized protein n=1 Tax=Diatraea saccharalis TaxID=40085 RepID=A0A9N9MZU4_9NEOP|nr:unnamed protein product [Diatraea saccharalis]
MHFLKKNLEFGVDAHFWQFAFETYIDILKKKLSEFDLDLDSDVCCVTTDDTRVMVKVGSLINSYQQLSYAHGIQLAVVDMIYKQNYAEILNEKSAIESESVDEVGSENSEKNLPDEELEDDAAGNFEISISPTNQVSLAPEYAVAIKRNWKSG